LVSLTPARFRALALRLLLEHLFVSLDRRWNIKLTRTEEPVGLHPPLARFFDDLFKVSNSVELVALLRLGKVVLRQLLHAEHFTGMQVRLCLTGRLISAFQRRFRRYSVETQLMSDSNLHY
jgi:hypothetical protein